jgi:RNA polymerase sigma-70 factor (ECF subfamily)
MVERPERLLREAGEPGRSIAIEPSMTTIDRLDEERLVALITAHQRALYIYIFSLVRRAEDAQDILQETNLVLWRKAEESAAVDNFKAWAFRIAFIQVQAHHQRRGRDRHRFCDELLSELAVEAETRPAQDNRYLDALRNCVGRLTERSREELWQRYNAPGSVQAMAEVSNRTPAAVSQSLYRIRNTLLKCISRQLQTE